jgi:hypothetical protein
MKKFLISACLFAILPLSAFAAEKSKTVNLDEPVQIAGKQLKAGNYKLKWDDSSDQTNVTISQGKDVIATTPARILHQKNTNNAKFELNTADGTTKLDRVYLSNEVLDFGNQSNPGM